MTESDRVAPHWCRSVLFSGTSAVAHYDYSAEDHHGSSNLLPSECVHPDADADDDGNDGNDERSDLGADDVLTIEDLKKAVRWLRRNKKMGD